MCHRQCCFVGVKSVCHAPPEFWKGAEGRRERVGARRVGRGLRRVGRRGRGPTFRASSPSPPKMSRGILVVFSFPHTRAGIEHPWTNLAGMFNESGKTWITTCGVVGAFSASCLVL